MHPGCWVFVDLAPELTFECVESCSRCCHGGVLLYEQDRRELEAREPKADAVRWYRRWHFVTGEPKRRQAHVGEDGEACAFLRDDGRCALHARHDWKPTRCSVFPLAVTVSGGELHVTVRRFALEVCEGLGRGERRIVDGLAAFLPVLLWDLEDPSTEVEP